MEHLLSRARSCGVRIIFAIRAELWHENAVPEYCSSITLRQNELRAPQLPSTPASSNRSTPEPEELENAYYIGFTGYRPIEIGVSPKADRKIVLPKRAGFGRTHLEVRYSEFGTWVVTHRSSRKFTVNRIEVNSGETAGLLPEEGRPNQIQLGSDYLSCIVVYESPLSLDTIDKHLLPRPQRTINSPSKKLLQDLRTDSQSSTSSNASSSGRSSVWELSYTNYHLLDFLPVQWSITAYIAIRARPSSGHILPGARYLAHQFGDDHRKNLSAYYLEFRALPRHPHLAAVVDLDMHAGLLIQEYFGLHNVQSLNLASACMAFRQLLSGLRERHTQEISHGCIEPRFIIENASNQSLFHLDGYWHTRICEDHTIQKPPFQPSQDLRQLAETISKLLWKSRLSGEDIDMEMPASITLQDLPKPLDPLLFHVISAANDTATQAEPLALYVNNLTLANDDPLLTFTTFPVEVMLNYLNGRDRIVPANPAFKTKDLASLWDRITRANPDMIDHEDIRLLRQLQTNASSGTSYTSRNQLKKDMKTSTRRRSLRTLLDLLPRKFDSSSGTLRHNINVRVSCIRSYALVNLTQLIGVTGFDQFKSAFAHAYEIRGMPGHGGFYAHVRLLDKVPAANVQRLISDLQEAASASRVTTLERFPPEKHILFATSLPWCGIVIMRRDDLFSNWDPFSHHDRWLHINESYKRCDEFGLVALKETMKEFVERRSHDRPFVRDMEEELCANITRDHTGSLIDSEADDKFVFRRKRKSNAL